MSRKLTHAEHVADIAKANPNVEVLGEIINARTKVLCRCKICGHEWRITPSDLKHGYGCPECGKIKRANAKRKTHTEQVAAINKVNPDVEVLGEITGDHKKVLCHCKICSHKWEVTPNSLKIGRGCPRCGGTAKLTHTEQVEAINKANPDVEVLGEIINDRTKVLCRCKICHHEWEQTAAHLKQGHGCPRCAKIKIANARILTHAEQVRAIAKVNPDVDILGKITKDKVKVLCRCKVCRHEWNARPYTLKSGCGCPRCAKRGFHSHDIGKLYIMVDDLNVPTIMKIGVSINEDKRSRKVLKSAHKAGVSIPALYTAKTWEGPTDLMCRIEQMMHDKYAEWNIKFPAKFDGYTEFFQYTPGTAGVFDAIDETYYTVVNQF